MQTNKGLADTIGHRALASEAIELVKAVRSDGCAGTENV